MDDENALGEVARSRVEEEENTQKRNVPIEFKELEGTDKEEFQEKEKKFDDEIISLS